MPQRLRRNDGEKTEKGRVMKCVCVTDGVITRGWSDVDMNGSNLKKVNPALPQIKIQHVMCSLGEE